MILRCYRTDIAGPMGGQPHTALQLGSYGDHLPEPSPDCGVIVDDQETTRFLESNSRHVRSAGCPRLDGHALLWSTVDVRPAAGSEQGYFHTFLPHRLAFITNHLHFIAPSPTHKHSSISGSREYAAFWHEVFARRFVRQEPCHAGDRHAWSNLGSSSTSRTLCRSISGVKGF